MSLVTEREIEKTTPQLLTVAATAITASATRLGLKRRSFFSIIPITAGVTVTVVFGDSIAVANQGIPLSANQPFSQSLDTNGRGVFQGTIQLIASGAGQVAFTETFED